MPHTALFLFVSSRYGPLASFPFSASPWHPPADSNLPTLAIHRQSNQKTTQPAGTMTTSFANRNRSLLCLQELEAKSNRGAIRSSTKGFVRSFCPTDAEQLEIPVTAIEGRSSYQELSCSRRSNVAIVVAAPIISPRIPLMAAVCLSGRVLQI